MSEEYVRGLVEGEGCFTFDTKRNKRGVFKIPTFTVQMHERDQELLRKMRITLDLKDHTVYVYRRSSKDSYNRGRMAKFIVRDYIAIKEKIVPFFYKKLHGNKGIQFEAWLEKIGSEDVPYPYKGINRLWKEGYYEKFAPTTRN